uniref:Uncharacterized protein n=1 Tax=Triticum urartu TaxID=4572 RepID=A0A8R7TNQ5_TRIUA
MVVAANTDTPSWSTTKLQQLIGTPAAEVHHRPQPLLGLLRSPLLRHRRRRGRKLLRTLRDGAADVGTGLGSPVDGPERVVPAAESSLILECLHGAHARRHHPRRLRRTRHDISICVGGDSIAD